VRQRFSVKPPSFRFLLAAHVVWGSVLVVASGSLIGVLSHLAGAVVDPTHAGSMIMLAILKPNRRRLALTSAATALALAAAGAVGSRYP
jgi:hypothetical protein